LKAGIILVLVVMSILTPSLSYGASDTSLVFGTRFIPSNIVEDTEGMIHVFAKQGNTVVPVKIEKLTVTSLDASILRVLTIKNSESGFVSELIVKGVKAGTTKLFLAAPGFSSQEIPITVHSNVMNQEQLLVKVVPNSFSLDGPFRGLVSVQLTDSDGFPVKASEDVNVSLSVANYNILDISQKELIIKKGEYFSGTHFTIKDSGKTGKTNIFATAPGMESKSNDISVDELDEDLKIKLDVFPKNKINVFGKGGNVGHIIVQLQSEDDNEPVIASKDIIVKFKVTNDVFASVHTSSNAHLGETSGEIKIKKGSYWGHGTFSLLGKTAGKYTVTISAGEPLSLDTKKVEAFFYTQDNSNIGTPKFAETSQNSKTDISNYGDRFVKFEPLPIFATGNKELIGVIHLEDESNNPIIADKNLEIKLDSSDNDFLKIDDVFLQEGSGSALVFGLVGHSIPADIDSSNLVTTAGGTAISINPVVEVKDETVTIITTQVFGTGEASHKLVAEPLIDKILANTEFPIVLYLSEGGKPAEFPKNTNIFVSPSDIFAVETKPILRGDDLIMLDTKARDKGKDTLQFTINDVEDFDLTIDSLFLKPANIVIDHSETIYTGANDVFSIELLNSENKPVFATEDIEINFVVNDESKIQIPTSMVIKKGEYYALFDAGPKTGGITEISALAEGLPISTTNIRITSLTPELLLNAPEIVENQEVFTVKITAKQDDLALSGLNVNWNVQGGTLQLSDSTTGKTGEAIASIMSTSGNTVDVKASVSGSNYSPSTISKSVKINSTASEFLAYAEEQTQYTKPEIGGIDPVIILVPAMIGLMGYMLFKRGIIKVKNPPVIKQPQI
jgi:hypothetical protein